MRVDIQNRNKFTHIEQVFGKVIAGVSLPTSYTYLAFARHSCVVSVPVPTASTTVAKNPPKQVAPVGTSAKIPKTYEQCSGGQTDGGSDQSSHKLKLFRF